ncbi:MAG: hypothetical protein Ct9H90mP16_21980 [Candidatus Poseidoniales archaeon]|nr:MAG: hypothetical protein Ct9H90mP16_21980 [Candidatus Poseidoniales archaeon]
MVANLNTTYGVATHLIPIWIGFEMLTGPVSILASPTLPMLPVNMMERLVTATTRLLLT